MQCCHRVGWIMKMERHKAMMDNLKVCAGQNSIWTTKMGQQKAGKDVVTIFRRAILTVVEIYGDTEDKGRRGHGTPLYLFLLM